MGNRKEEEGRRRRVGERAEGEGERGREMGHKRGSEVAWLRGEEKGLGR